MNILSRLEKLTIDLDIQEIRSWKEWLLSHRQKDLADIVQKITAFCQSELGLEPKAILEQADRTASPEALSALDAMLFYTYALYKAKDVRQASSKTEA